MQALKNSLTHFEIFHDGIAIKSGVHHFALGRRQGEELARMIATEVLENSLANTSHENFDSLEIVEGEYFERDDSFQFVICVTYFSDESELFTVNLK
jgi:hypothetical protein